MIAPSWRPVCRCAADGGAAANHACNCVVASEAVAGHYAATKLHMNSLTDRIERQILLKAPRSCVWRALSNAEEFDAWFGVALTGGAFTAGQRVQGHITYPGFEHVVFDVLIGRVEAEKCLSWRWHPAAIDRAIDYSQESTTLVLFELKEVEGDTLLGVVECGFDNVPPQRRADAFRMNSGGWEEQMKNIEAHVATP